MQSEHLGPHHYSIIEAATYLQLHPRTVYDLVRNRLIQYRRKGPRNGRIYFLQIDLEAYLTQYSSGRAKR